MTRSTIRIRATLTLCAVASLGALGACTKKIDRGKAQSAIKSSLSASIGVPVTSVSCPDDIKLEKGGVFMCDATFEGDTVVKVKVEQTDSDGTVTFGPATQILASAKLADLIAGNAKNAGEEIKVDCGNKVYNTEPPTPIPCTFSDAAGTVRKVNVLMDATGNFKFEDVDGAKPPAGTAPAPGAAPAPAPTPTAPPAAAPPAAAPATP
jgi:hypothetical protein